VLLADLDHVDGPLEPDWSGSGGSPEPTSTRRVASSLHWVSSSTCWQRMTRPPVEIGTEEAGRTYSSPLTTSGDINERWRTVASISLEASTTSAMEESPRVPVIH
jgi:hypothetical protein